MDYEKKYKEALEKARKLCTYPTTNFQSDLEDIFPELGESEDEKIRKALVKAVSGTLKGTKLFGTNVTREDALAWLEKQGVKEQDARYENLEELLAADDIYQMAMNDAMVEEAKVKAANALSEMSIGRLLGFEKQDEQKPVNKVEPKFKVKYAGGEYNVLEVKDIAGVTFYGIEDEPNHIDYVKAENCKIIGGYSIKENGSPYPTKPAMFSEQKPVWSEEDERNLQGIIDEIEANKNQAPDYDLATYDRFLFWLKSIKERIGEKPKEQVDGFDAELNALLKKYEYLPKEELAECLEFYLKVVNKSETEMVDANETNSKHQDIMLMLQNIYEVLVSINNKNAPVQVVPYTPQPLEPFYDTSKPYCNTTNKIEDNERPEKSL